MKLKQFIEGYKPNTKDEERFIKKHAVRKIADRNGNSDDVFQATNIKKNDREDDRHGYNPGSDEKVYEEVEQLEEKTLKPGQKVHRQELAKLIRKANPHIEPAQAYAMAVATAERVNESLELDEKVLTPNEKRKKEEIVKALKRDNPGMDLGRAYAIATDTAKKVTEQVEELDEAKSLTTGMRLVSKHEGKDGHHAEVRHNKDWDEFQVHHFQDGKHLGEGPVSYHDSKKDAQDTANYEINNFKVKGGSLVKESEQLDEVSKGTLKKYVRRAAQDLEDKAYWQGRDEADERPYSSDDHEKKSNKRHRGIRTALKKLTKEDIINGAIAKYLPDAPKSVEDVFEARIEHLGEGHQKALRTLFGSLSDANKSLMVEQITDNVNALLDFAIQAKEA